MADGIDRIAASSYMIVMTVHPKDDPENWFTTVKVDGPAVVTGLTSGPWRLAKEEDGELTTVGTFQSFSGSALLIPQEYVLLAQANGLFASGYFLPNRG